MKKTYQIEVDCANCANLMEQATKKTDGVADATVNFMTHKMIVEFAEGLQKGRAGLRDRALTLPAAHRKIRCLFLWGDL